MMDSKKLGPGSKKVERSFISKRLVCRQGEFEIHRLQKLVTFLILKQGVLEAARSTEAARHRSPSSRVRLLCEGRRPLCLPLPFVPGLLAKAAVAATHTFTSPTRKLRLGVNTQLLFAFLVDRTQSSNSCRLVPLVWIGIDREVCLKSGPFVSASAKVCFLPDSAAGCLPTSDCFGLKAAGLCGAARAVDFYDRSGLNADVAATLLNVRSGTLASAYFPCTRV